MKINNIIFATLFSCGLSTALLLAGCQKGDITTNPNAGSTASTTLLLNTITSRFAAGGGVTDGETGAISEAFYGAHARYDQYHLSNYSYYAGTNTYNWSYGATQYSLLKYVILLEDQAATEYPSSPKTNIYAGLAKFFRAYCFIWTAERLGDIPMDEAGKSSILQPAFNTQKEVYTKSLALLDSANTIIGNLISNNSSLSSTVVNSSGDIFDMTYLQWQKIINAYTIRTLISLSKRADDNTDMGIATKFATIINDPTTYPIPESNTDNMHYTYNSYQTFPLYGKAYSQYANVGASYLRLTTASADPRTFAVATPAPALITAGKSVDDFSAYAGSNPNLSLATLKDSSDKGYYSFLNYNRYYTSSTGANCEEYVYIGYPELCFNIAEGINRGWATGSAATWYNKGVQASLDMYSLVDGESFTIGDKSGTTLGTVDIDIATFLGNITYQGGSEGLVQILNQKYVAMFENSPMEAYFNWRRTGYPALMQGGSGIGTSDYSIPRRWQYPNNEATENATNYQSAIESQFGGTDDIMQDTWLTK